MGMVGDIQPWREGFLSYRELEKTGITQDHWDGIIEESFLKQLQHSEGEMYND